jgi:hypothetical protein
MNNWVDSNGRDYGEGRGGEATVVLTGKEDVCASRRREDKASSLGGFSGERERPLAVRGRGAKACTGGDAERLTV